MARVEFLMDDLVIECSENTPLIDLARSAGASIPFGCTNGVCGTCIVKVVEGMGSLSEMTSREEQTLEMFGALDGKHRLACQCKVKADVKIDNP